MGLFVESYHRSKYETAPLQEALQQAYSEEEYLFGGPQKTNTRTKVAVTATTAGNVFVLANYNRYCIDKRKSTVIYLPLMLTFHDSSVYLSKTRETQQ